MLKIPDLKATTALKPVSSRGVANAKVVKILHLSNEEQVKASLNIEEIASTGDLSAANSKIDARIKPHIMAIIGIVICLMYLFTFLDLNLDTHLLILN